MGKFVAGVSFLVLSLGVVGADEFLCQITKIEGKKVTAKYVKVDKDAKKGGFGGFKDRFKDAESKTFTLTDKVKVVKKSGKFDAETKKLEFKTETIEEGLKDKMFTEITEEKPLRATFTTDDDGKVTEISVTSFGKGGFGDFKKKKKNDTSN